MTVNGEDLQRFIRRLRGGERTRIVAFGSSNTEARNRCRFNWFDWLDTGLKMTYGRVHHSINTGIGGDTTRGLLKRFDTDVAIYQPHLVFLTIGGNDASPAHEMSEDEFRGNLTQVARQILDLDDPVLTMQTYYGCDLEQMEAPRAEKLVRFMDIVRETAGDLGCVLIDHMTRWDRLRTTDVDAYRALMNDPMHLNPTGNMVMGLDLVRLFEAELNDEAKPLAEEGYTVQERLDELEAG